MGRRACSPTLLPSYSKAPRRTWLRSLRGEGGQDDGGSSKRHTAADREEPRSVGAEYPEGKDLGWPRPHENTPLGKMEDWKELFLLAAEKRLRSQPRQKQPLEDEQLKWTRKGSANWLDSDILRTAQRIRPRGATTCDERKGRGPVGPLDMREARAASPKSGRGAGRTARAMIAAHPIYRCRLPLPAGVGSSALPTRGLSKSRGGLPGPAPEGWLVHQRQVTPRPRARGKRNQTQRNNQG